MKRSLAWSILSFFNDSPSFSAFLMMLAASFFAEAMAVEALFFSSILAMINPNTNATIAIMMIVTILSITVSIIY